MAKKKMKVKSNSSKSKKRRIFDSIAVIVIACVMVASLAGYLVLNNLILADGRNYDDTLTQGDVPTTILDKNGETATQISGGDGMRENITFDQVPQVVIDAFLAVEDSRFYKHNGFDLPRFLKSMLENIKHGAFAQGGSTLTMQMIDVTHVTTTDEQNAFEKLIAKAQEVFLALDAEGTITKDEIIMRYLNFVNFGGPARGIQIAAEYYFGKDVSEINLSEAAFLAGVVNAPNAYNPYLNYENAVARRNNALSLMKMHGYISEEEYQLALNTKLAFQLNGTTHFDGLPLQSYIDLVAAEAKKLGIDIYEGNMIIHTAMDLDTQRMYDEIMNGGYGFYKDAPEGLQSGSALINVKDGSVAAVAGGLNYTGNNRKNFAYNEWRQTGSSIKPLLDYTLAFEYLGWSTAETIADVPTEFGNYKPQNAGGRFRGDISIADAIAYSLNIPAIKALSGVTETIGAKRIIETMRSVGLSTFNNIEPDNFVLGMAIGGSDMVSNPLEMAAAYASLANGGVYTEPYTITKIEFLDGRRENYEHVPVTREVFSEQAAYLTTEMLVKAVSYSGTFQSVLKSPYQVATKTGTSDWGDSGKQWGIPLRAARDKWTVSYTSEYSIATWMGYDNDANGVPYGYLTDAQMNKNIPSKINKMIFDHVHKNNYPADFVQPSGVVNITHLKGDFGKGHYSAPEGTPSNLIVTGKIKSEFASLKSIEPDDISSLSSFTAKVNEATKKVEFAFTPYPDTEATKEFDGLYHGVPADSGYSGTKAFDKRLVYGPIAYKVEAFQNGKSLGVLPFSSESGSDTFKITPGIEAKVCGYYGYANHANKSNQICVTLSASETQKLASKPINPDPEPETPNPDPTDPTNP